MKPFLSFPTHIQIQTTTYCGAQCTFCPHHRLRPVLPMGFMAEELFYRLIDECSQYPVEHLSLYLMAEPLTDQRIFRFAEYTALKCPRTTIELSTTGQLLDAVATQQLLNAPLGELRISSMGVREQDYRNLMPGIDFGQAMRNIEYLIEMYHKLSPSYPLYGIVLKELLDEEAESATRLYWEKRGIPVKSWRVKSRAGNAFGPPARHSRIAGCRDRRHSHWMHVLHDGRVVLCCMDWKQEVVLGDAQHSSLKDIWQNEAYSTVREWITGQHPAPVDFVCRRCECALGTEPEPGEKETM